MYFLLRTLRLKAPKFPRFFYLGILALFSVWCVVNLPNQDTSLKVLSIRPPTQKPETWLALDNYNILAYSAYLDCRVPEKPLIRILLYKPNPTNHRANCLVRFENATLATVEGEFYLVDHMAQQNAIWKYECFYLNCLLNQTLSSKPTAVAIQLPNATSAFMPLIESFVPEKKQYKLVVCTKPLQGAREHTIPTFVDWLRLTVFIEYYLAVGASHIILYNNSVSQDVNAILQHYVSKGVVSTIQMPPVPTLSRNVSYMKHFFGHHRSGQHLQINDCILRTANRTRFWTDVDLDEFIGVRNTSPNSLADWLTTRMQDAHIGGITIRSAFWRGQWPEVTPIHAFNQSLLKKLQLFEPFEIGDYFPAPHRAKMILRPESVVAKSVHMVFEYYPSYKEIVVQPEEATVYHLRYEGNEVVQKVNPFKNVSEIVINNVRKAIDIVGDF